MWERHRCEVLNLTYERLKPVSFRRALQLVIKGKATLLEEHPTLCFRSFDDIYPVPVRIVLKKMVKAGNQHVPAMVNNRNLFLRDNYTCQYCGRHKTELSNKESLTRDHIHPQDKGGQDVWMNLVTACNRCNNKKGNSLLEDTNMKLLTPPRVPTTYEIQHRMHMERK